MAILFVIILLVGVIAVSSIWSGYVFSILWAWFIVPLFGLPALSVAAAIGVTLVVRFLTHQRQPGMPSGQTWASIAIVPLVFLAIGWVVKGFM